MTWNRRAFGSRTVGDAVAAATHYPSPDESFEVPRSTDTPIGDAQDPRQAAYSKYLRTSGGGLLAVVLLLGCNAWAVTTRLAWCCLFQRVGHDHLMQGKASELASSLTLGHRSSLRSSSFTNTLFSASRGQHCRWDVMCGSHAFRGGRLQHPTRAYLPAHPHTSSLWGCVRSLIPSWSNRQDDRKLSQPMRRRALQPWRRSSAVRRRLRSWFCVRWLRADELCFVDMLPPAPLLLTHVATATAPTAASLPTWTPQRASRSSLTCAAIWGARLSHRAYCGTMHRQPSGARWNANKRAPCSLPCDLASSPLAPACT